MPSDDAKSLAANQKLLRQANSVPASALPFHTDQSDRTSLLRAAPFAVLADIRNRIEDVEHFDLEFDSVYQARQRLAEVARDLDQEAAAIFLVHYSERPGVIGKTLKGALDDTVRVVGESEHGVDLLQTFLRTVASERNPAIESQWSPFDAQVNVDSVVLQSYVDVMNTYLREKLDGVDHLGIERLLLADLGANGTISDGRQFTSLACKPGFAGAVMRESLDLLLASSAELATKPGGLAAVSPSFETFAAGIRKGITAQKSVGVGL